AIRSRITLSTGSSASSPSAMPGTKVAVAAAEGQGMGPAIAGGLLWTIGSVRRFPRIGGFFTYAGLHVIGGKAPKRRKGVKKTNTQMGKEGKGKKD
ncbi:MAG: hypothetical protein QXD29_06045, partial [Thermoplasmata archaeon]